MALGTRHGALARMLDLGIPEADPATAAAASSLSSIEHVVFLIQENRSYDHYFGSYKKGRGFDDHPKGDLGVFAQPDPQRKTASPKGVLLPWHLDTQHANAACTFDIAHEWSSQHLAWNGGKMDQFLHAQGAAASAPLTMGYYTRADLPLYHALADAFTLCDGYHCSALSPTDPNRHHALAGTIDPDGPPAARSSRTHPTSSRLPGRTSRRAPRSTRGRRCLSGSRLRACRGRCTRCRAACVRPSPRTTSC